MKQLQFRFKSYIFAPTLFGALLTIICIVLFIKFGLWQYHKATIKQDIQARYNAAVTAEGLDFPATLMREDEGAIEALKYQKVKATGYYLAQYTVLLDNQTEQNRVGYHVITPLKLAESEAIVLVNRGWIEGNATHAELPDVSTPQSLQNISGQVWVPSTRYFTLEKKGMMLHCINQIVCKKTHKRACFFSYPKFRFSAIPNNDQYCGVATCY